MVALERKHRSGWRRRARSHDRWEMVLTLPDCTAGEIWEQLQRQTFLSVAPDAELNREWEYTVTEGDERPADFVASTAPLTQSYRDRMMRGQRG